MAFSLVVHAFAQASGSLAQTPAQTTTGANLIVLLTVDNAGGTPFDSKGNTWTALTSQTINTVVTRLWYSLNPTVGTLHTFTLQNGLPSIAMAAYSGALASSAFDVQNGSNPGSGTSIQPGSVTPSQANELVIYGTGDVRTTTASVNSGTILDQAAG